ncbi:MAG: phenylalanine--tRNA ligase subunit beta [Holosporales bacterium]|jgi:phenylalanyl-tRNA synthetase beta chain|nr:phenylalanine--tRNA ligase subunit beta [Holosporales bacterium]
MKFTFEWLKEHLETNENAQTIANKLCEIGFEVEEFEDPAAKLKDITVAFVESVEKHPNADKLNICKINDGTEKRLNIVCGAKNVKAGMKTAFVHVGGIVPKYCVSLKAAQIRGIDSQGMLCSFDELGIEGNSGGIIDLETDAPPGSSFAQAYGITDQTFTINITPNRGDCFSVRGLARELAAAGMGKLKKLDFFSNFSQKNEKNSKKIEFSDIPEAPIKIGINTPNCSFFYGAVVENLKNCESPKWLQERIKSAGQRPINALVDVTNFLNFDIGQPSHVYDAKAIKGNITIRQAKPEEKILALNSQEYSLTEDMMVVADDKKSLTIAGVMGGEETCSRDDTFKILFEIALFDSMSVAKTGQTLGLSSESRTRFERGIDPEMWKTALEYGLTLITSICGGTVSGISFAKTKEKKAVNRLPSKPISSSKVEGAYEAKNRSVLDIHEDSSIEATNKFAEEIELRKKSNVSLTYSKLSRLSGDSSISMDEAAFILRSLGFKTNDAIAEKMEFEAPSWRHDIEGEEDLIEEVIRIRGYRKLRAQPMPIILQDTNIFAKAKIKEWISIRGLNEVYTLPFLNKEEVEKFGGTLKVLSPLNAEKPFLRESLVPSLLNIVFMNQNRNCKYGAIFEVESIFKDGPFELTSACGMRFGVTPRHWLEKSRMVDVFDVKADIADLLERCGITSYKIGTNNIPNYYHPGRAGEISRGKEVLGYFGEIHPSILASAEISLPVIAFELFFNDEILKKISKMEKKTLKAMKISNLQPLTRDFCFILDKSVSGENLVKAISGIDSLIETIRIFDIFEGNEIEQGKQSIAFQIVIQPDEKTLNDENLAALSEKIILTVRQKLGGELKK